MSTPSGRLPQAGGAVDDAAAPVDYALVRSLQRRVADRLTADRQKRLAAGLIELTSADERQLALAMIREEVATHVREQMHQGLQPPPPDLDEQLVLAVESAIFGAGALQYLLDDPGVENIDINGCDEVWVTYADQRGRVRADPVAATDEDLIDAVRALGAYAGPNARPFTPASPELDLRLPDGSRLSALMSASERPLVCIRRSRFEEVFLSRVPIEARPARARRAQAPQAPSAADPMTLTQLGTIDEQLAAFLQAAVLARCNIIVAGATDAGKTTLLRALVNAVPPHERLVTVERALELGLRRQPHLHPDVAELEEVLPAPDGSGGVSIGALVRRSRRLNPSRVIVGEVLGPEVVEMLSAMSQGNDGSLSTIHSRDGVDVFSRLALYAAQYEHLDFPVTHALVGSCVDLVVFVRKNPLMQGRRAVMEVLEVTGSADGAVIRSRIFAAGPDGRAIRERDVPIARGDLLAAHGYDDDWTPAWNEAWSGAGNEAWAPAPPSRHLYQPEDTYQPDAPPAGTYRPDGLRGADPAGPGRARPAWDPAAMPPPWQAR